MAGSTVAGKQLGLFQNELGPRSGPSKQITLGRSSSPARRPGPQAARQHHQGTRGSHHGGLRRASPRRRRDGGAGSGERCCCALRHAVRTPAACSACRQQCTLRQRSTSPSSRPPTRSPQPAPASTQIGAHAARRSQRRRRQPPHKPTASPPPPRRAPTATPRCWRPLSRRWCRTPRARRSPRRAPPRRRSSQRRRLRGGGAATCSRPGARAPGARRGLLCPPDAACTVQQAPMRSLGAF